MVKQVDNFFSINESENFREEINYQYMKLKFLILLLRISTVYCLHHRHYETLVLRKNPLKRNKNFSRTGELSLGDKVSWTLLSTMGL